MKKYYPGAALFVAFCIRLILVVSFVFGSAMLISATSQELKNPVLVNGQAAKVDAGYRLGGQVPVKLNSFSAKEAVDKVLLNWATDQEKNASHFVIERSFDGKDYSDRGMIFTEGNSDSYKEYHFMDDVNDANNGVIYYRLKIVDLDGSYQRSDVKLIPVKELNEQNTFLVCPNPVVNELRITLPVSWQGTPVKTELINTSGRVVKQVLNSNPRQTESIQLSDISEGIYIVKLSNGKESAIQRIVKSK